MTDRLTPDDQRGMLLHEIEAHVDRLIAERDAAQVELAAIRELVGGNDGESTRDAVQWIVTEWEHYSKEMNRAGYETIPKLTAERDAALALVERLRAAGDALLEHTQETMAVPHRSGEGYEIACRICGQEATGDRRVPPVVEHTEWCYVSTWQALAGNIP